MNFHKDVLVMDAGREADRIVSFIRDYARSARRNGAVIGLSGGIDSALASELCVRAFGKDNVHSLILPERDSNPVSAEYGLKQARKLGIASETIEITPVLEALGAYEARDGVVRKIFPDYEPSWTMKISLPPDLLHKEAFNVFTLSVTDGRGRVRTARLDKDGLNGIVAATNTKQRTRMVELYMAAERRNYFVCGTTNRTENLQGFFVKYGDGGVDIEPLAHLFKTQIFQLSAHLGVIEEIRRRKPSPDTYSFTVSDEEFFYRMPIPTLDLLLYGWENKTPVDEIAKVMDLTEDQVKRAFRDFASKFSGTEHVRQAPPTLPDLR